MVAVAALFVNLVFNCQDWLRCRTRPQACGDHHAPALVWATAETGSGPLLLTVNECTNYNRALLLFSMVSFSDLD